MKALGVDGCKAGWFAVSIDCNGNCDAHLYSSIQELWQENQTAQRILIDIPIGFCHDRSRQCDLEARKKLGKRSSCVFPAPCRDVLKARTYKEACQISRSLIDKAITIQAWGILPKILEVDEFLTTTPKAREVIRESHPEICFWSMAGQKAIQMPKRTPEGQDIRLEILTSFNPYTEVVYWKSLSTYKRNQLAKDDILDALVLALTASKGKLATLPEMPEKDAKGLPMEIVYADV